MNNVVKFPARRRREREATAWLIRMDGGDLSATDHAALSEWFDQHPDNMPELLRQAKLWDNMAMMSQLADLFPLKQRRQSKIRPWIPAGLATALILLAMIWVVMPTSQVYSTGIGEQQVVTLADGSQVNLNTSTTLEERFVFWQRRVSLLRGEAHFDVAHNDRRPFVVTAGDGEIRALGTAFTVYNREHSVEVLVTEGQVRVAGGDDDAESDLTAGQAVSYDRNQLAQVNTLPEHTILRRLAWRDGMIAMEEDSLAEMIREMNRYTSEQLVLTDPRLGEIPIAGYFRAGDLEPLLTLLQANFGLDIDRDPTAGTIYIGPGRQQQFTD